MNKIYNIIKKLQDKLGDLLFQVIYLSEITKEKNKFNFNYIVKNITKKMIKKSSYI